ncbi:protein kinase domain-containing protein, partial [Piscirickettsia salmonis]
VEKTFFEKAYPDTEVLFEKVDTLDCRLVMPLFPGKDFHNTLKSYPHRTDEVIVAVALELHRLHLLKMQHGDIKFD